MRSEAHFFRIGLFVILGALILAGSLIAFGLGQVFRPRIEMVTYVDATVQGIDVGSPVKFRGVTIGRVRVIDFLFTEVPAERRGDEENLVVILMEIDKEVFPNMFHTENLAAMIARSVDRGLRIRIEPQGITGLNYLEINYVDSERFPPMELAWTPEHYYIPSAPGEITSLLDSVNNIMREIENLNIQGISDGTVALLTNLNQAVEKAQIEKLSTDAQRLFGQLATAVEESDFPRLSTDSRALITELGRSNEELLKILANIEPASRLNADEIAASLSNLKIISDHLRVLSGELSRDPSLLIFSRPPRPASVFESPTPTPRGPRR